MKRLTAILLLALLLYNAFGYYLLFAYESKVEVSSFIKNMSEKDFNVLKFNLAIYTSIADREVEYVNEEMIVGNKTYHIVKKFIKNDTLNVFYLRNHKQDELRENLHDIIESQSFSKQSSTDTPIKKIVKSFLKDYMPNANIVFEIQCPQIIPVPMNEQATLDSLLLSAHSSCPSPPPKMG